jgi:hypothetical protein
VDEKAFWIDEDKYPLKGCGTTTTLKEYEELYAKDGLLLQECMNTEIYSSEQEVTA